MPRTFASPETVSVAWLKSLGLTQVGTTVPEDTTRWATTGFVQPVKTGTGRMDPDLKLRSNVFTIHMWGVRHGSTGVNNQKVPWGQIDEIGESIVDACFDRSKSSHVGVTLPESQGGFDVKVLSVIMLRDPERAPSDDQVDMAHTTMDIQIFWVQLPD